MKVLALDMGGTFIKYAICNVDTNNGDIKFIEKDRFRTSYKDVPYGTIVVENMAKFAAKIIKKHPEVKCICSSVGGVIDTDNYINGKLHLGKHWAAGEVGPMVVNNHYYENHYALPGLIRRCKEIDNNIVTAEDCLRLAKKHRFIKNIVDAWFVGLMEGIASMIYMMDPEYFIFGGKITEDPYFNLKVFKKLMLTNARQPVINSFQDVKFVKAKLGNDAALYGVASLAYDNDYKL